MTDPQPGQATDNNRVPTRVPVEFEDDGEFRHMGFWNAYQFDPPLLHTDAIVIAEHANELGYRLLFRLAEYSQQAVQAQLVDRGPSSFLDRTQLQEDISRKEPPATAEQRMATRLRKLGPISELLITDPYLFTGGRRADSVVYAESLSTMMAPALAPGLSITAVVHPSGNDATVRAEVQRVLRAQVEGLSITIIESEDFHDRFWIADRQRGLVIGASLNKIGRKIFFVDELSDEDVAAVLAEVDAL